MHSNTRRSQVMLVENLPRTEIKKITKSKHHKILVLDYDLCNDSTISFEDFIFKWIKKKYFELFYCYINIIYFSLFT